MSFTCFPGFLPFTNFNFQISTYFKKYKKSKAGVTLCPTQTIHFERQIPFQTYVRICLLEVLSFQHCWWFRNPANQLRLVVYPNDGCYTSSGGDCRISESSTVWVPLFYKGHCSTNPNNALLQEISLKLPYIWHLHCLIPVKIGNVVTPVEKTQINADTKHDGPWKNVSPASNMAKNLGYLNFQGKNLAPEISVGLLSQAFRSTKLPRSGQICNISLTYRFDWNKGSHFPDFSLTIWGGPFQPSVFFGQKNGPLPGGVERLLWELDYLATKDWVLAAP